VAGDEEQLATEFAFTKKYSSAYSAALRLKLFLMEKNND
jgi:hypothetical protein